MLLSISARAWGKTQAPCHETRGPCGPPQLFPLSAPSQSWSVPEATPLVFSQKPRRHVTLPPGLFLCTQVLLFTRPLFCLSPGRISGRSLKCSASVSAFPPRSLALLHVEPSCPFSALSAELHAVFEWDLLDEVLGVFLYAMLCHLS